MCFLDGKQQSPLASSGLNMETMSSLKEKLNTISFTLNNFIIQSYPSLVPSPTTSGPFINFTPSLSVTATPTENVQASQGIKTFYYQLFLRYIKKRPVSFYHVLWYTQITSLENPLNGISVFTRYWNPSNLVFNSCYYFYKLQFHFF